MINRDRALAQVNNSNGAFANPESNGLPTGTTSCRSIRRRLSDPPPHISESDKQQLDLARNQAENLQELSAAAHLRGLAIKSFGEQFTPAAFQAFRDKFLRDAGDPMDPIEQLLLEQLVMAHFHILRLHQRASDATSPETTKVFYGALARLQGEARRLALAIRLYRSPVEPRRFTVVKQQNVAVGDQQVALVERPHVPSHNVSSISDNT